MIIPNQQLPDSDPAETQEWMDSLLSVVKDRGVYRARSLVRILMQRARALNLGVPELVQTPYINTIPPDQEPSFAGDEAMEKKNPPTRTLECRCAGDAGEQALRRNRRAHFDLCFHRFAV